MYNFFLVNIYNYIILLILLLLGFCSTLSIWTPCNHINWNKIFNNHLVVKRRYICYEQHNCYIKLPMAFFLSFLHHAWIYFFTLSHLINHPYFIILHLMFQRYGLYFFCTHFTKSFTHMMDKQNIYNNQQPFYFSKSALNNTHVLVTAWHTI